MTQPDRRTAAEHPVQVEICVDDLAGAMAAEANGADRIELCGALVEGGTTPSLGLVQQVLERVPRIGVRVMIRPRGGDFIVSAAERDVMLADIALIRALAPADRVGFVFGAIDPAGGIDRDTTARLKAACGAAPTTFHKAFDSVADQSEALEQLIDLGIGSVLTSGGAPSAEAGTDALRALVAQGAARLTIIAGGGVRAGNLKTLLARSGVRDIHLRAMRPHPSRPPTTSAEDIAAVVAIARGRP